MTRNERSKVLLSICSLDSRCEESSKWSYKRCEESNEKLVNVHRLDVQSRNSDDRHEPIREGIELRLIKARNRASWLIKWAVEMRCLSINLVTETIGNNQHHIKKYLEHPSHNPTNDECATTTKDKSLPRLVRRQGSKRSVDIPTKLKPMSKKYLRPHFIPQK